MEIERRSDGAPSCPFNHNSADYAERFPEILDGLREQAPLAWSDENRGYWMATSYKLVRAFARDGENFEMGQGPERQGGTQIPAPPPPTGTPRPLFVPGEVDGEVHDRYRTALTPMFTKEKVGAAQPMIERHITERIAAVAQQDTFDVVSDLAQPILALVGCEYIGVDVPDPRAFVVGMSEMAHDAEQNRENSAWAHVGELIQKRREEPTGDVISHLANWTDPVFDVEEVQSMVFNVALGAAENTATLIAGAIAYIDTDDALRSRLISEPGLMGDAVVEFVRYITPAMGVARTAMNDVTIDDITLHAGERILLNLWAANHDPARFENPRNFDLDRGAANHLGFGVGMHFCLGSLMARSVAATTLTRFLEEFPNFAVDRDKAEPMVPLSRHHNGWRTLPVTAR